MAENILPSAEFQALPLQYIIAAPLKGVIEAQKVAADSTKTYIESMIGKDGKPISVSFDAAVSNGDGQNTVSINAPLLSIVPVPHIRIDSFTTKFSYQISQVSKEATQTSKGAEVDAKIGGNPWVKASVKGHISSTSSKESTMNRSGSLEITVNASESPMPEGLARLMTILSDAVTTETKAGGGGTK